MICLRHLDTKRLKTNKNNTITQMWKEREKNELSPEKFRAKAEKRLSNNDN